MLGSLRENHPGRGGTLLGHYRGHQHQQGVAVPPRQHRRYRRSRYSTALDPGQLRYQLRG